MWLLAKDMYVHAGFYFSFPGKVAKIDVIFSTCIDFYGCAIGEQCQQSVALTTLSAYFL